ncbi:MAG: DUF4124 domain-containing protein [Deltaproteobacteria bacterium]|nr:DUF4124 domain-containing protein [Deltaproteobacteria bacterium]
MNYLPHRRRESLNSPHPPLKLRGGARGRCSASQRLSGGFIVVVFFFLINLFLSNAAEIYRWTDDEGVVHITDDRSNIPDKYWVEERVKKEEITPSSNETEPVVPEPAQTYKEGGTGEVFGDYPLAWWIDTFRDLRKDIADSQESLDREKNFVTVFDEGGRRYPRKIYTKEEIAQYERSKADIPVMEDDLKNLNKELEELQRKARIYGVPKKVTE